MDSVKIALLGIGDASLPAFPEDADPLEGQGAQDFVVVFAFGPHALIVVLGPGGIHDGLAGPLDKGLALKLGGQPAPMSPEGMAALFTHRSDARQFLQAGRFGIEVALGAKSHAEPWGQVLTGPGEVAEQPGFGMGGEAGFDFLFQQGDMFVQSARLVQQRAQVQDGDTDARLLGGQRLGLADELQALFEQLGPPKVVSIIESFDHAGLGGFKAWEVGPTVQERPGHRGVEVAHQLEGLGIIAFDQAAELVEHLLFAIHQVPTGFDQAGQLEGLGVLGLEGAQFGGVVADQFQEQAGIGQVVSGARRSEGFAIASAGHWVDGINRQPGVLDQGVNDRAATGLNGQHDGPSAVALLQFAQPAMEGLGRLGQGALLGVASAVLQSEGVLSVTPVQTDPDLGRRHRLGGSRGGITIGSVIHV